jgi:uncharacterized protein YwgA
MNRLQLATLLSWAGDSGFKGRKRMQKVVYLLQHAGCPLDCRYTLHFYGPYSRDVAAACDEMVAGGLIVEKGGPADAQKSYIYQLAPRTRELLKEMTDPQMADYESLGKDLLRVDLWELELASTILYFQAQTSNWETALEETCRFKKVADDNPVCKKALQLAKGVGLRCN